MAGFASLAVSRYCFHKIDEFDCEIEFSSHAARRTVDCADLIFLKTQLSYSLAL